MTNQQTTDKGRGNPFIAVLLCWLLIGQFLWNLLIPVHEGPLRHVQVMTMAVDFLMIASLIGIRASVSKPLFWIALVAGIGLFGIRLTSETAWWTGHLTWSQCC